MSPLAPYVITYYLSDRAESVDFRNLWSKTSKSLNTVQQIAMLLYNDNIISAGAISKIGLLFHVVFYQIFNYFERCLWFSICIKTISQGEGHFLGGGGGVLCWENILHFKSIQ